MGTRPSRGSRRTLPPRRRSTRPSRRNSRQSSTLSCKIWPAAPVACPVVCPAACLTWVVLDSLEVLLLRLLQRTAPRSRRSIKGTLESPRMSKAYGPPPLLSEILVFHHTGWTGKSSEGGCGQEKLIGTRATDGKYRGG